MSALMISTANDKDQTVSTINGNGIYYQELRLGDRPMSKRVRIGTLVVLENDIVAEYDALSSHDACLSSRVLLEKEIAALSSLIKDAKKLKDANLVLERETELERKQGCLNTVNDAIANSPITKLQSLNAKSLAAIDKMIDKARARHQKNRKGKEFTGFNHFPTQEYFLEKQANELLKKHNDKLEAMGIDNGYIDFDSALAIVCHRFSKSVVIANKRMGVK
jgi:hypothetical protein